MRLSHPDHPPVKTPARRSWTPLCIFPTPRKSLLFLAAMALLATLAAACAMMASGAGAATNPTTSTSIGPAAFMWPPDRVWSADADNTAPCGSIAGVQNRTTFPLRTFFSYFRNSCYFYQPCFQSNHEQKAPRLRSSPKTNRSTWNSPFRISMVCPPPRNGCFERNTNKSK